MQKTISQGTSAAAQQSLQMDQSTQVPELIVQRFAQIPTLDFGKIRSGDSKSLLIDVVNPSNEPQELRFQPLPINGKLSLKILDSNESNSSPISMQCSLETPHVENTLQASQPRCIKVDGRGRCRVEFTWRPMYQYTLRENFLMLLWGRIGLRIEVKGQATQRKHTMHSDKGLTQKNMQILDGENQPQNTKSTPHPHHSLSTEPQIDQENKVLQIQGLSPVQSASPTRIPLAPMQQSCRNQPDIIDTMLIDDNNDIFATPPKKIQSESVPISISSNIDDGFKQEESFFTPASDFFESVPSLKFRPEQFSGQGRRPMKSSSSFSSFGVKNKSMTNSSRLSLPSSRTNVTSKSRMRSRDEQKRDYSYCQKEQVWEKQESALVKWLNLKLATFERDDNKSRFVDERTQSQVRGMLMRIVLKDDHLRNVMTKIEERIDKKLIVLNAGNNYLYDIYKKKRAVSAILCFNSFWVKLVLELIAKNQQTTLIEGASWYVKDSEELIRIFLFNEHPDVYSSEFDFETPAFKRMLQMLLILDICYPQITEKITGLPLLFNKNASFKSTEAVFAVILEGSVFGAGDIVRDFGRIGYRLVQTQQVVFEFDFDIKNLAVDLRDGIRLARLVEVVTHNKKLLTEMKYPPISKTTKRWNVARALFALQSGGIQLTGRVDADDIVEGSREKTLLLLWEIQQTCLVERQLDVQVIYDEINSIKKGLLQRGVTPQPAVCLDAGMDNSKVALLILEWAMLLAQSFKLPYKSISLAFLDGSLLCYMVKKYIPRYHTTDVYEVRLDGMEDFSDWVDFYVHFDSLPLHSQQQIRLGVQRNYDAIQQVGWLLGDIPCLLCADDSFTSPGPDPKIILMFLSLFVARLLHASGEEHAAFIIQRNWRNAQQRKYAGDVGITTIQQWKAAVKVISRYAGCWLDRKRIVQAQKQILHYSRQVTKVQAAWRGRQCAAQYKQQRKHVVQCQSLVRRYLARHKLQTLRSEKQAAEIQQKLQMIRLTKAAVTIQRNFQVYRYNKKVIKIQAQLRMIQQRKKYQNSLQSINMIQLFWRSQKIKQQYEYSRQFIVKLQAIVRGFLVRKQILKYQNSAIKIQSYLRMWRCANLYKLKKQSAQIIQYNYRTYKAKEQQKQIQDACIMIQKNQRRYSCRKRYLNTIIAVRRIQQNWQGIQEAKKQNLDQSATTIQKFYKCYICQKQYQKQMKNITKVQAAMRGTAVRRYFCDLKKAVVMVEKQWRFRQERLDFCRQKILIKEQKRQQAELSGAIIIQRQWRWLKVQQQVLCNENGSTHCWCDNNKKNQLQEILIRQYLQGKVGKSVVSFIELGNKVQQQKINSAKIISTGYLDYRHRQNCRRRLKVLGVLQRQIKVIKCRRKFKKARNSCIIIQKYWRKYLALRQEKSAAKIQGAFRGFKVRQQMGSSKRQVHQRLLQATKEVQQNPKKQIGIRCKEALEKLLAAKSHVHIAEVCEHIKSSTAYSKMCCELIAKNGGVSALLKFIRSCNRSGPHVRIVSSALDILENICRYNHLLPHVFKGEYFLECLTERLQLYRDMEVIFLKVVGILRRVLSVEEHMCIAAQHSSILKQWHGIQGLLERKRDSDAFYLSRLEGKKGSDVCAQQATRRLVNVKQQLEAFYPLINLADQVLACQKQLENENQKENTDSLNRMNSQTGQTPMTSKISSGQHWQPKNVKIQEAMKNYNKRKGKTHQSFY